MPLREGYSKEVIGHNIRAELQAGKERDQALAIALSKSREARARRKMWLGGTAGATEQDDDLAHQFPEREDTSGNPHADDEADDDEEPAKTYADGGVITEALKDEDRPTSFMHYDYKLSSPHQAPPELHHEDFATQEPDLYSHAPEEGLHELAKKLKLRKKRYY